MATSSLKLAETAYRPAQLHSEYIKYFSYQNEGYQISCDFYKRRKQGNILYKQTILYFLKTLCTRTKAVNFGQSRCGVAACRPTSPVLAQLLDQRKSLESGTETQWFNERGGLCLWSKVLEQHPMVFGRQQAGPGRGFTPRSRERLPVMGAHTSGWLISYQGNQKRGPLR